jgi:hypothetical protein
LFVGFAIGCTKARPVEAPIIEIVLTQVDASAPVVASPARGEDESAIVGQWEGIGRQDARTTWPMIVDITTTELGLCATVDYPSIPCHGEWVCTGDTSGALEAVERLDEDSAERCVDGGAMAMRLASDGTLDWRWRGGGQTASAKLRRVH